MFTHSYDVVLRSDYGNTALQKSETLTVAEFFISQQSPTNGH